jgi:hypothetical protein
MVEEQIQQELDSAGRTVAVRSGQIAGNLPDAAELRTETEVAQRSAAMRGSPVGDDAHGSVYPLLLCSKREGQTVIAAVAAARFSSARRTMPDAGLLESLAELLLEHDDIDAVTCLA